MDGEQRLAVLQSTDGLLMFDNTMQICGSCSIYLYSGMDYRKMEFGCLDFPQGTPGSGNYSKFLLEKVQVCSPLKYVKLYFVFHLCVLTCEKIKR